VLSTLGFVQYVLTVCLSEIELEKGATDYLFSRNSNFEEERSEQLINVEELRSAQLQLQSQLANELRLLFHDLVGKPFNISRLL
jgi:hypothetical protein